MSVTLSAPGATPGIGTCSAGASLIALSPHRPDGCGRAAETAKQSENVETQKPFKWHSSDDVRALRRQADRERKRAARQQATDTGANLMAQRYRVWSVDRQRVNAKMAS